MIDVNFARLNHILIPATKTGRDRFRKSLAGKMVGPLVGFYEALSDEGRMLSVVSLIVGGFALDVGATQIYLLWSALAGLLVASLVARAAYGMKDVRAEVIAPKRVTVGEEARFAIVLTSEGDRQRHALRVRGPFLPWDGRWIGESPRLRKLAARGRARVEVRARFAARGEHHLDPFRVAALVPLGLTLGRSIATGGCRFLVVPKIAPLARLALPMGRRHQPGGIALASKTGESMDLLGVRPYRVGDPIRDLHARSWARLGTPVVREYQEEYFSRIGVIVDTGAGAGASDERRLEAALSLAAGVVAHLSRGESLIDLLVVGDVVHDLTLGRHLGNLEQALDLLAMVERGKKLDGETLLARLAEHLPRLSCVVVVSFDGDDTSAAANGLAERVRGYGVGCKTLLIGRRRASAGDGSRGRDTQTIGLEAIERGEALAL
jgi:uncharacterized protein (DUF58 family)